MTDDAPLHRGISIWENAANHMRQHVPRGDWGPAWIDPRKVKDQKLGEFRMISKSLLNIIPIST